MTGSQEVLKWCGRLSLFRPAREMLLIEKWLYKYKNAQRRDKAYQKLHRVKKDFTKYFNKDLHTEVLRTVKQALATDSSLLHDLSTTITALLNLLSDCIKYSGTFLTFMESTFSDLVARIEIGHNVPMIVVAMASLSRVWFYMRLHFWSLIEAYQSIAKLYPSPHPHQSFNILHEKYEQYLPVHKDTITSKCEIPGAQVVLTDELIQNRLQDFERPTCTVPPTLMLDSTTANMRPTNTVSPTVCVSKRHSSRVPNVVHIVLFKQRRRTVFKMYNKQLAQKIWQWKRVSESPHCRKFTRVEYLKAAPRRNLPFKHRAKLIRLKLSHTTSNGILRKSSSNTTFKKNLQLSCDINHDREHFLNTNDLTIDEIFNTIDTS